MNTAHDFTSNPNVTLTGGRGSVGLCTFCHTPHSAVSTQLGWNHTLSKNVFDYGVAATTAGTPYPKIKGDTYKGPSVKCLSCHDGSVAIGDVASFRQGAGVLSADKIGSNGFAVNRQVGASGNMAGSHPVAMPYPLYRTANTYNGITSGAQLAANDWVPDPTTNNIRLYSDDGAGNIVPAAKAGATGIECSSCHDPHNKASRDEFFLRGMLGGGTQASGYLCAQCHAKGY
ncbi:MAG: hypothetical protein HY017_25980 [Betaproteobacteria bacterium]|nr:hypothetical protein [Betaproteobacteria bacterium]